MADVKLLDDMIDQLGLFGSDYVFVFNTNGYNELGDTYKGKKIRRFKFVDSNSGYLMPDPMITDKEIQEFYGRG